MIVDAMHAELCCLETVGTAGVPRPHSACVVPIHLKPQPCNVHETELPVPMLHSCLITIEGCIGTDEQLAGRQAPSSQPVTHNSARCRGSCMWAAMLKMVPWCWTAHPPYPVCWHTCQVRPTMGGWQANFRRKAHFFILGAGAMVPKKFSLWCSWPSASGSAPLQQCSPPLSAGILSSAGHGHGCHA